MKMLVLLTSAFPYDNGEEFLSEELKYISGFDRVLICPCNLKKDSKITKKLPKSISCKPLRRKPAEKYAYAKLLAKPYVLGEIASLIQTGRFSTVKVHELLFFLRNANEIYESLLSVKEIGKASKVTIYSYWFYDAAAAGILLARTLRKRGIKVTQVSRAHGFDVHEERSEHGYLPMRRFLLSHVDRLYPCSLNGVETIANRFPEFSHKIETSFLGTCDCGEKKGSRSPVFHLVSCSYMVAVKRLHLIVEVLRQVDFPVLWTHIGSGPLEKEMKDMAKQLPGIVQTEFLGQTEHDAIMRYYQNNDITAFVNVSSSEGIPVSVMEACSFGIPVVATDVGGTGEAVFDGENGYLLPADFQPEVLVEKLRVLQSMPQEEYDRLCSGARASWMTKFNAAVNYRRFYEEISR